MHDSLNINLVIAPLSIINVLIMDVNAIDGHDKFS